MPQVEVPPAVLLDEPATVRITGVAPAAPVRITVTLRDTTGRDWEAKTTVRADGRGVATLQPGPADPPGLQGLIQALTPPREADKACFADGAEIGIRVDDGTETVTAEVTRRRVAPEVSVADPGAGLGGHYYRPPGGESRAAVLAIPDRLDRPWTAVGGALSAPGQHVLAVAAPGTIDPPPAGEDCVPLSLIERAIERLRARSGAETVSIVARGLGTQAAIILAARRDDVRALVCYSPAAFVTPDPATGKAVWADEVGPLPMLDPTDSDGVSPGVEAAVSSASPGDRESPGLPVEGVEAPVFLATGRADAVWPATDWADLIRDGLGARVQAPDHRHASYPGAGHDMGIPFRPTTLRHAPTGLAYGGEAAATARAESDLWPQVRSFLAACNDDP